MRENKRDTLAGALAKAVLPAYAIPALSAFAGAQLVGSDELAETSYTTIAIPSAIAALAVALWLRSRSGAPSPGVAGALRAIAIAAASCFALAFAASGILVAIGAFDAALFGQAPLSAAIGGGIVVAAWVRSPTRRLRPAALLAKEAASRENREQQQRQRGSADNPCHPTSHAQCAAWRQIPVPSSPGGTSPLVASVA